MEQIRKYPRTPHLAGSGLQAGDEELAVVGFGELAGKLLVVEEKMDGANCGVSFGPDGRLRLQSRGHYLTGGPRERQFNPLKSWASRYAGELWELLGDRYVLYGEWCYGKHTIFYNDLPNYLLEFDLYDAREDVFLSTARRMELLRDAPFLASVHVLHRGPLPSLAALQALVGPSRFIVPGHREELREAALAHGLDPERALRETDPSGSMEGLYVKVEDGEVVTARYKYVRSGFLQTVLDADSHWMDRPLLPNRLRAGVSLW
jgi:RNA ligase